jgi:hypothetical protein
MHHLRRFIRTVVLANSNCLACHGTGWVWNPPVGRIPCPPAPPAASPAGAVPGSRWSLHREPAPALSTRTEPDDPEPDQAAQGEPAVIALTFPDQAIPARLVDALLVASGAIPLPAEPAERQEFIDLANAIGDGLDALHADTTKKGSRRLSANTAGTPQITSRTFI